MDPVSQGVLGAVCAQAFAGKGEVRLATVAGVAGGMAADLDILIRSTQDPLLTIEYHRHFTHSLAFVPIGGLVVAAVLWPLFRRRTEWGFKRWWAFATIGYATAGVLDACTSYGTRLMWPFSDARLAWDLISIIDPLFTLPLLWLAARAVRRRSPAAGRVAVLWALLYLGFGCCQRERAEDIARDLAAGRGHVISRIVVKPSIANLVLWRSTYETADGIVFVDAIRIAVDHRIYEGGEAPRIRVPTEFSDLPIDSRLRRDIDRFDHFSGGWLGWMDDGRTVLADLRYATLPDELSPLWGIEIQRDAPDAAVAFRTFRRADGATWRSLWSMLRGADRE